jgi:hypothetical protein
MGCSLLVRGNSISSVHLVHLFLLVASCSARSLHPLDSRTHASPNGKGTLRPMPAGHLNHGDASPAHLLQLNGSPAERGYAHGYLLAPQIIDWFVFYQFQSNMKGSIDWYDQISGWWLKNQFRPPAYKAEVEAMLEGMKASSTKSNTSMFIQELNREFSATEIYMINAYLEATPNNSAITRGPFVGGKAGAPACSQFVTWGAATKDGLPLAGRNMDGECDAPHYATVHHLIVSAVAGEGEKRFISVMWPGHIGGLSLFNEDGLYLMLNCGSMGPPGTIATNLTGIEYIMRSIVSTMSSADATPAAVGGAFDHFASSGGGPSGAGSVIVFARQAQNSSTAQPSGFVAEHDRFGGRIRTPAEGELKVVQTNHFVEYGVGADDPSADKLSPWLNFGKMVARPGVSSHWRLEALKAGLETKVRMATGTAGDARASALELDDVGGLLSRAGHGATEHSIAFAPNSLRFALAVAAPESTGGAWDAQYQPYRTYDFDEVFAAP